jgi:hypothetical protein
MLAVPKCLACVIAYSGLGAGLGWLSGPELCGANPGSHVVAWIGGGMAVAIALAIVGAKFRPTQ